MRRRVFHTHMKPHRYQEASTLTLLATIDFSLVALIFCSTYGAYLLCLGASVLFFSSTFPWTEHTLLCSSKCFATFFTYSPVMDDTSPYCDSRIVLRFSSGICWSLIASLTPLTLVLRKRLPTSLAQFPWRDAFDSSESSPLSSGTLLFFFLSCV